MPIEVKAVSKEDFERWVETAQKEFARVDPPRAPSEPPLSVADAAAAAVR